jgi:hypothetical protein
MTQLVRYEALKAALADALIVDEVKDIRDKAEAMRAFARMTKDKQLEIDATEIRARATRRIGEMMAVQPKQTGGDAMKLRTRVAEKPEVIPITLADAGIDKTLHTPRANLPICQKIQSLPNVGRYANLDATRVIGTVTTKKDSQEHTGGQCRGAGISLFVAAFARARIAAMAE